MAAYGGLEPRDEDLFEYTEVLQSLDAEDIMAYRALVEAKEDVELLGGYIVVELDAVTSQALVARARERGLDPSRLASDVLREFMTEGE